MAMQVCAKASHDLGKDAMINYVLAKGSMVANLFFFGNSQCSKPWYPCKIHVPARRFRRYSCFAFRYYSLVVIPDARRFRGGYSRFAFRYYSLVVIPDARRFRGGYSRFAFRYYSLVVISGPWYSRLPHIHRQAFQLGTRKLGN